MAELTLEQQRALALARARVRVQQQKSTPDTQRRETAIAAEEKAARQRLAERQRREAEYTSSTAGRVLEGISGFFGETPSEARVRREQENLRETLQRLAAERQYIAREGKVAPTPTAGQRVVGGLKAIPRGAIESTAQALGQLGILGKEGEATARSAEAAGTRFAESIGLGRDETAQFDPWQRRIEDVGAGLGSILPYVASEVVGRKAAPLTKAAPYVARGAQAFLGSGQGATQARQQMDEYEAQTGKKLDPTTRRLVQAGGGVIGLTELLPIGRMVETASPAVRAGLLKDALAGVERTALERVVAQGFVPEALQEGGTQLAQNLLAQQAYNPEQDLTEGVGYSALLGGVVGGSIRGVTEMAGTLGRRAAENRSELLRQALKATEAEAAPVAEEPVPEPTLRKPKAAVAAEAEPVAVAEAPVGPTPAEVQAQRISILRDIAAAPDVVDKHTAFEQALAENDLGAPNIIETTALRDLMRQESDLETTAGRVEDIRNRELQVARMDIIEPTLYNPGISEPNKIKKINADLRRRGMDPLTSEELNRVYGYEAVNAVFGPEGEVARKEQAAATQEAAQRQGMLQEALASEEPDKYRAFASLLDEAGLGEATAEELSALQGEPTAGMEQFIPNVEERAAQQAQAEQDAAFEEAVAAREQELLDEEVDYDNHPLIQENESLFEDVTSRAEEVENYPQLRSLLKKLQAEGVLDEDAQDAIREAADDAEKGEKFDAAYYALMDAIEEARDLRADDIISGIDEELLNTAAERARADVTAAREVQMAAQAAPAVEEAPAPEPVAEAPAVEGEPPVQLMRPQPIEAPAAPAVEGEALTPGEVIATREDVLARLENAPLQEEAPVAEPAPTQVEEIGNPEEDVVPVEQVLADTPDTVENLFPADVNRPRAESIGFAADMQQRLKRIGSDILRKINYKYQDAVDYSRMLAAMYGVTRLPENMDLARRFELLESRKIGGQMSLRRWFLDPLENKLKELELDPQDVGMYLWARSAPARNALVFERTNGEVTDGSGMSDEDARAVLKKLASEGLTPKLEEVAKIHDNLVDYMGKERVAAGLLSKEDWLRMRNDQPFYTPLKGYALQGDMQVVGDPKVHMAEVREADARGGGRTRIREYLTAKGRTSMPFNPLFGLMSDAQFAIARIERNRVAQTLLRNVLEFPEDHADVVKVYAEEKTPGATTIGGDALNQLKRRASEGSTRGDRAFIAKDGGKTYYLDFQNTPAGNTLYRAFANMTPQDLGVFMNGGKFRAGGRTINVPGIQAISNGIKSLKTRFNPSYLLGTAWQRDFQEAILTNLAAQGVKGGVAEGKQITAKAAGYMFSPVQADVLRHYMAGTLPKSPEGQELTLLFDQFLKDGGAVGHSMVMDAADHVETFEKALRYYKRMKQGDPVAASREVAKMGLHFLDTVSQVIDMQARFATYRAALEEGISRDGAASLALDSSLNLTRRGEWAPMLDAWSFFFSAGVEGARKTINQGLTSRNARKLLLAAVNLGVLAQLWNWWQSGDDDEDGRKNVYDVNDSTMQSRVVFYYGPGTNDYVAIPTAFSMGLGKYLGEQVTAAMLGDITPGAAAVNSVSAFRNMALPIKGAASKDWVEAASGLTPDMVQPFSDLAINRNHFGSTIYNESPYSNIPRSELGRKDTASLWQWVAQGMNSVSGGTGAVPGGMSRQPEWYEYLADQYGGGLFAFGADIAAGKMPKLVNVTGKGGEFAPMNNYYLNTENMNAVVTASKAVDSDSAAWADTQRKFPVETDSRVIEAYAEADKALRALRKEYKGSGSDDPTTYYADRNEVYKAFNRVFNEVQKEQK